VSAPLRKGLGAWGLLPLEGFGDPHSRSSSIPGLRFCSSGGLSQRVRYYGCGEKGRPLKSKREVCLIMRFTLPAAM
jgi:hypothetical protein